jgi:hypothetical protein
MESLDKVNVGSWATKIGGTVTEDQRFDSSAVTAFTWNYVPKHEALRKLYERGKSAQWNGATDLDWSTDVDLEQQLFDHDPVIVEEPWYKKMTPRQQNQLIIEANSQTLCQFLHGEQGALIATSQLVSTVHDMDAKYYAATQVMDEARHVEVFDRYVREKLRTTYPITENLFGLLKAITEDSRWDIKFLGMQLLVEGLALAAFMNTSNRCHEPLLKKLLRMVMQDEARHVAYGVLSLRGHYSQMDPKERLERQEFVYEATIRMRDRLFSTQAYERMGVDRKTIEDLFMRSGIIKQFRSLMFVNVVPNMKKIGLLEGFLAEKFAEMGILQLQDFDTEGLLNSYIYGKDSLQADQQSEPKAS